jgi:signal transduction histidine kinase
MINTSLLRRSWRSWTSPNLQREGPYWLQLVWTGLFACVIAAVFTVVGFVLYARGDAWWDWANWRYRYGLSLVVSLIISYLIQGIYDLAAWRIGPERINAWPAWRRNLFFTLVPMAGVAIGWPLGVKLMGFSFSVSSSGPSAINANLMMLVFVLMFSVLLNIYFTGQARAQAAERSAAEARLKLLQGQIEPHFLFNTLANVVSLIEVDPARARTMLETFIDYLRASLGGLRREDHTLGHEVALVQAYLGVLGLRMEERLQHEIEVPAELLELPLPALLIQPLVENAIHHGLEPKVEGGRVSVRAQQQAGQLVITVADNGLGRAGATASGRPGTGTALANIRERLQQAYGAQGRLELSDPPEGGCLARLVLPLAPTSRPARATANSRPSAT